MRTSLKIATYTGVLGAAFAGAFGVGSLTGSPAEQPDGHDMSTPAASEAAAIDLPAGLQAAEAGYILSTISAPAAAAERGSLSFSILGPDGQPATQFTRAHEKNLHLIIVRTDTAEYRHVHPALGADGTWTIDWHWPTAGTYKVFADFVPTALGEGITLARTVEVAGDFAPAPFPAQKTVTKVAGNTVTLAGDFVAGQSSRVTATIERDEQPVTTLEPYLGAYGHLVALREGDLAYLHVHPDGEPGDGVTEPGPTVSFVVEVPTAGSYRLFLEFQIDGQVHTADFTVKAGGPGESAPAADEHPEH